MKQDNNDKLQDPEVFPFPIIYRDKRLLVINKSAGITVQDGCNVTSKPLTHYLREYFNSHSIPIFNDRCGLVHRLDRETSGLCMIALDQQMYDQIQQLFRERLIRKTYLALVTENRAYKVGTKINFSGPIAMRKRSVYFEMRPSFMAKEAKGTFIIKKLYNHIYWVEAEIVTGRTHQIRVQLDHLGMPVIGDSIYGVTKANQRKKDPIGYKGHYLHAWKLAFSVRLTNELKQYDLSVCPPAEFLRRFNVKIIK